MGFGQLFMGVFSVVVGVTLAVNVIMPTIIGANTTTWNASTIAIWAIAPLAVVIGTIFMILGVYGMAN